MKNKTSCLISSRVQPVPLYLNRGASPVHDHGRDSWSHRSNHIFLFCCFEYLFCVYSILPECIFFREATKQFRRWRKKHLSGEHRCLMTRHKHLVLFGQGVIEASLVAHVLSQEPFRPAGFARAVCWVSRANALSMLWLGASKGTKKSTGKKTMKEVIIRQFLTKKKKRAQAFKFPRYNKPFPSASPWSDGRRRLCCNTPRSAWSRARRSAEKQKEKKVLIVTITEIRAKESTHREDQQQLKYERDRENFNTTR